MRVRRIAQVLYEATTASPQAKRRAQLDAFLHELHHARRWKLLPRIVAALERIEIEAGTPPMAIASATDLAGMPKGAAVTVEPAMLGGASVRSGDTLVDTSLAAQLRSLSTHLTA